MDMLLLSLYIGQFTINSANSAIAPFFPQRAIQYGISESLVGVIFATHPFGNFVCTFFLGKRLQIGENRKTYTIAGIILTAIGMFMFAFVFYIEEKQIFIIVAFASRAILGIGQSLFSTPGFAFIPILYKENFEELCAYMESIGALGLMIGPILGSLLLQLYGYSTPFVFFSLICLILVPILIKQIPQTQMKTIIEDHEEQKQKQNENKEENEEEEFEIHYAKMFQNKFLLLNYIIILFPTFGLLYLEPTMSIFFSEAYQLNDLEIGLLFSTNTIVYIILTPLGAKYIKKFESYEKLLFFGCFIMGISFIFVGPEPLILQKNLTAVILANICIGIACILIYIPALPQLYRILKCLYPEENDNMIGDISSALYNTSYALGEFLGPLIGGFFAEFASFPRASSIFGIIMLCFCYYYYKIAFNDEINLKIEQNLSTERISMMYGQQIHIIDNLSIHTRQVQAKTNLQNQNSNEKKIAPKYYTPVLKNKSNQKAHFIVVKRKKKQQSKEVINEKNSEGSFDDEEESQNTKKISSNFQIASYSEQDLRKGLISNQDKNNVDRNELLLFKKKENY